MYMMNDREFSNRKETLHGEFYENALKYPERIALIYENEKVSYKMLRLYALRAANYMWQRGVRRNDKIVVILPRGIGQVAALLGILAIGAAYVPIAMKQPLGRRKKIIENVKPALVLQDEAFLEENPWTGCIENNSKDTAYIIYTSGSSGEPKGVEMSHVAAMNTIEEILHMWNIGAEDSVLNISAFDFDLSVFDIFGLLTVGGTIVLIDEDDFRDPEVWKNLIEIYGITIWNSAPALLDMFLIMGENNHFGKLRLALVSGDWIPLYLPEKWYKVTSANSQFVALGGATEGGIWSNYYCVSKVDKLWNSIPYGQALPKQKYRITDENFVECGVDIPGELQIGGGSLAKGYINDEELTMKKFITDVKGERWYRTGDRGRRWADGTIEFLGRMDTQVKIRGHRIELGEIESVLKSISRIKEAVVVAQGDKYHKELVAFYLGEYIAESEIEDYLKIHLPEYSIPNSINRLENFPLNANGKVDRRRLAEYQKTDSVEIMSDKVLNIVLMIWEELLKNKVADLDENLFKIGADSLLAARFVAAINARCGIEVRNIETIKDTGMYMAPNIQLFELDIDKESNIGKFFKGSDLVIGAIGPSADYSEKMLLGAMAENIPYVDPGGIHLIRKMRNSSMKGTAIVGSGIFPGLSGWMLSSVLKEAFNDDLIEMIIGGVYNFSKAAAIDYVEEIKSYKAGIPMACVRNGKILPAQKRSPLNLPTRISKLSILPYVTEEIQEIIQGKYMLNIDSYTAAPVSLFSIVNKAHCQKKDLVNALMGQKNSNQKAFIWVRQNKGNDSRCIYFEGKNPSVLTGEILAITANAIFEMPRKDGIYTMASYLEKYQVLDELKKIDKFKSEGKI